MRCVREGPVYVASFSNRVFVSDSVRGRILVRVLQLLRREKLFQERNETFPKAEITPLKFEKNLYAGRSTLQKQQLRAICCNVSIQT